MINEVGAQFIAPNPQSSCRYKHHLIILIEVGAMNCAPTSILKKWRCHMDREENIMTYDPQKHHRRSIRMRGYDYSDPGAYFVTICTDERRHLFGEIIDDEMHLNDIGQAVQWIWNAMPERFPTVELDQYVILPNHILGIIILYPYEGAIHCAPTLGSILRTFKALATRYLHAAGASDFAWQRNYHEHITRKEGNLDGIRQNIIENPNRWTKDSLHIEELLQ